MRLRRLELIRYGGFSDRVLDFGAGKPDLHLVIGPNEAGKSTMLQAIGDLLFGIPTQSAQNWRYDYGDLRIRALLGGGTGDLDVTRRKGKRNTLLAPDGSALADDALAPWLGGMDRRSFERMFGLDHTKLREGGEAILVGKDDAARIVLEAGTGFAGIGQELKKLEEQAAMLFKPSAQIPVINRLMRERTDALATVRSTMLSDSDWATVKARRDAAEATRASLVAEGRDLALRAHAIERINRIRPLLARRSVAQEVLNGLGPVRPMPTDAGERLSLALAERGTAQELQELETGKRERARTERKAIELPDQLLAAKAGVETLASRLAVAEKAGLDLVQRKAEQATLLDRSARVRIEAGLAADHAIPGSGLRKRLRDMLEDGRRLDAENSRLHQNRQAIDDELGRLPPLQEEGTAEASLGALRAVLDRVPTDAAGRMKSLSTAREKLSARLDDVIAGLAPWHGTVEALRKCVPPAAGETLLAANGIDEARASLAAAEAEIVEAEKQVVGIRTELAALSEAGVLPTPEVVASARARRDAVIQTVRVRLDAARADDDALVGAELRNVTDRADRLADRRDADAHRVAQHGVLSRRKAELEERIGLARGVIERESVRLEAATQAWADLLRRLAFKRSIPPADVDRWRTERDRALAVADELREAARTSADFEAELGARSDALNAVLAGVGQFASSVALPDLLERARHEIARLDEMVRARDIATGERGRLDKALESLRGSIVEADRSRSVFEADRKQILSEVGLSDHLPAVAVADALDAFDELAADVGTLTTMERQILLDEKQVSDFTVSLGTLLEALGKPSSGRPFEQARVLSDDLGSALRAQATLRRHVEIEQEAEEGLVAIEHRLGATSRVISDLMGVAGASSEEELAELIEFGRKARGYDAELARLAAEILGECEGLDPAVVTEQAATLSPDEAAAELDAIRIRRVEIEEAREAVGRELASAEADMSGAATATGAADAQQDAVAIGAAMAEAAERHVEVATAAALLRWMIDRHRATAQAPLIERAGALFAQVTAGAFTGLVLDYDEDDRPLIKGLRANSSRVGVDGMSEGTRDQLYLALRLGAVAGRGVSQALPVICDDLLITADDGRATEMLRVLAAASRDNQIILFSHHEHLIDVARSAIGNQGFVLHRIDRTPIGAAA